MSTDRPPAPAQSSTDLLVDVFAAEAAAPPPQAAAAPPLVVETAAPPAYGGGNLLDGEFHFCLKTIYSIEVCHIFKKYLNNFFRRHFRRRHHHLKRSSTTTTGVVSGTYHTRSGT